ncbi:DHA2 family efflux MFS transporter permease subunit [Paracoccus aminophilus]|uniref:Major facilitator superfamily n=1 Tax=Paracoccus aminophilus JCM 7686 TaxID=1367847 RepID=S5YI52_PARAH|nr:DHA2 family efflux MFS transporter permease subunit [Paracoccus aminophilus]AGT11153.1 major facilitator superfamily [Paracoccus aminophilus JCM 7686]
MTETSPVKWGVVLAVVMTAILEVLDSTIVNVALPHMKAAFGITSDQTVWILTSYIVSAVAAMPLTGLMARRYGRRRLIMTAIIGFTVSSALCGASISIGMMVACRILQGLFGAFLIPLSQSILFDSFPVEKRGQAMALFGLGVIVAPILGPTVGAILTEHFSWRAVFYVNIPVAVLALLMMAGGLPKEDPKPAPIDWTGLILMVLAVGGLQMMLDMGESKDWFSSHFIQVSLLVFVFAGAAFLAHSLGNKHSVVDLKLFADRSFAAANIAMMGFGLAMFGTIAILPLFVQGLLDFDVLTAGYLFMPRGLAAGVTMVVTGSILLKKFDPRLLVACGLVMTGLGNIMLARENLFSGFWDLAWPGAVSGVGMGLFFVPMSTVAFQKISRERQDEASGLYGVVRQIGSSIGIAIAGWQVSSRTQIHWHDLTAHITEVNPTVQHWAEVHGIPLLSPAAAGQLTQIVAAQAQMLAFKDVFLLTGWGAFAMLPVVLLMERPHLGQGAPAAAH